MLLVVDNGSVFTRNLLELLDGKGIGFELATPGTLDADSLGRYDSFILSGRRASDRGTNEANSRVIRHSVRSGSKLLGICYGAEILALALGGTIRRTSPRRGGERVVVRRENPLCSGGIDVFESHGFEIARLPPCLLPVADSERCRYEIIRHENGLAFGTQFHPEMSPDGHGLIERFCRL